MGDNGRQRKERITREFVLHCDLVEESGVEAVDDYLYCLLNILRIHLGDDLRAVYLIGSYAHGGYASDSDVDVCFVFRDGTDRFREAWSVVEHLALLTGRSVDPMYHGVEATLYDPADFRDCCTPLLRLALKEHSLLLIGDDIRPNIALSAHAEMLQDVLAAPLNWIKTARNKESEGRHPLDTPVVYPLVDPASDREDRGFGDFHSVAARTMHLARALVFARTGKFVFNKAEIADAFARDFGGPWVDLVRAISEARYDRVQEHEVWLSACLNMTAFENYFLQYLSAREMLSSQDVIELPAEARLTAES